MRVKLILSLTVFAYIFCGGVYAQQPNNLHNRDFWKSKPSIKEIKKKIKEGNSPTEMTSSMFDATAYAILENNPLKTIKYLMSQGNDVNKITHDGRTYLFWAAYKGNIEALKYLLDNGASIDIRDDSGSSALMFSAATGQKNKAVYKTLIKAGIDIKNDKDRRGRNPLLAIAGRLEDIEMLDYFINLGLDVHAEDKNGNGVFHYVAQTRRLELLKQLVNKYGVNYSKNKKTNENAFYFATRRSVEENEPSPIPLYNYLESLGLEPALITKSGRNVLHNLSYRSNDLRLFEYFVDKGVNPALLDHEGNNPLINAASRGSKEKVEFFLKFSHDINHRNKEGYSAMTRALKYNSIDVVELLANHGASLKVVDNQNYDLGYHLVDATRRNLEVFDAKMKFLINHGYDPKKPQKDKSSLLHVAIPKQNKAFIQKILNLGVDINSKDSSGQTILHHAAMLARNQNLLKFLLEAGADKSALTEFEESAYDLARENEQLDSRKVNIEFLKPLK